MLFSLSVCNSSPDGQLSGALNIVVVVTAVAAVVCDKMALGCEIVLRGTHIFTGRSFSFPLFFSNVCRRRSQLSRGVDLPAIPPPSMFPIIAKAIFHRMSIVS
jgi:hypothetical protein